MALGIEGGRVRARHVLRAGDQVYCALSWAERPGRTERRRGGARPPGRHDAVLAGLARPGAHPRPPVPAGDRAVGAGDQGPDLHADGGDGGRADHVAARDPRRRAQLGLPLHVDAGLDLHPPGAALPRPRLGGRRVHAVRHRSRAERRRRPADHVRHRRPAEPRRDDPRRPLRLRGRPSRAHRQRGVRPAAERRVRRGARLDPAAHAAQRAAAAGAVADRPVAGRVRHGGVARTRPGHLGGPRQAAALRVIQAHVLGGARSRRQAGRDPRRRRPGDDLARRPPTRSRPTSWRTASTAGACCGSTTTPTRSTRRRSWPRSSGSCPATTSACTRASWPSPTS